MQDIVARIKQVMENEQMNAGEFADQLGIGRPLLSHVLGGRNNPSLQLDH
jgi:transcriptional regulator with XRE-family HTH domain